MSALSNGKIPSQEPPQGIGWAISSSELIKQLDSLGITYQLTSSSCVTGNTGLGKYPSMREPVLDMIIAIGLIIVSVSLFIIVCQLRRKGFVYSLARLGATMGVYSQKKPFQNQQPVVIGQSGYFAENEFPLGSTPVIFGRDPAQANIVYPSDMKEMSRCHAELKYLASNRRFFLKDLDSAGGTFLATGKQLSPGKQTALKSGESFYLVSPDHMFTVKLRIQEYPKGQIIGICGEFAQQVFPLQQGEIVFGRDPSMANIVFPRDMRQIGRRHARIRYDAAPKIFILEDLGSASGTFLAKGKRVLPGKKIMLQAGERFYLASKEQTFQVE